MSNPHIVTIVVENKFRVMFVDGVVRQMHVLLIKVGIARLYISFGCQTSQSFMEHV